MQHKFRESRAYLSGEAGKLIFYDSALEPRFEADADRIVLELPSLNTETGMEFKLFHC